MKYAIDLIWVKVGNIGGVESYIRNLLDGIADNNPSDEIYLITTIDNFDSFKHYTKIQCFHIIKANTYTVPISKILIWQNLHFEKVLLEHDIHFCFCPYYRKPLRNNKKITYVTTIHDLQQLHYPKYFTKKRYYWIKFAWKRTIATSKKIVAISDFDKQDIIHWYHVPEDRVVRIYNPIVINNGFESFEDISKKYNIDDNNYYFALSSMLKHKNLDTLLKIIKKIRDDNITDIPRKLIISGISGSARDDLIQYIKDNELEDYCILTPWITNEERNTLFKHAYAFLFPSIFEGFGMPPVEGLMFGTRVITTKKTSLYEVTKGLANYVDDPFSVNEWIEKIREVGRQGKKIYKFPEYDKDTVAKEYLELLHREFK